ncbi:MAG: hypothetical protein COA42_22120 [Alteromonadaceae bacterium]|nr:hypothetical protein [Colwellia sp.]PCK02562.1 MAG: hypothetical protein COA42_22120 [Alteromonadaceae bacterium]
MSNATANMSNKKPAKSEAKYRWRFLFALASVLLLGIPMGAQAALGAACLPAPPLPAPTGNIVNVSNVSQLHNAVGNLSDNTTIVLAAGEYVLSNTLYIQRANVTITGATNNCDDVVLIGKGMDNANYGSVYHGIWTDAVDFSVSNLTIQDVYGHGINFNPGAQSPVVYNVKLLNTGEQFIKSNPFGFASGNDNGRVEYTIMEYTGATTNHSGSSGYSNGVDVHAGKNWIIRYNLFKNFHTPDSAAYRWNPAVLMWNGASGTLTENNTFINVDRAIAYGLIDRDSDHSGGVIRNNMIYLTPGLMSSSRTADSDGMILVWDSPQTKVLHNTVITNGNVSDAIQLRFSPPGVEVRNNLLDNSMRARDGVQFTTSGNVTNASTSLFVDPANGDLHLKSTATSVINQGNLLADVTTDFDGHSRGATSDIGADEYLEVVSGLSPPLPPSNTSVW